MSEQKNEVEEQLNMIFIDEVYSHENKAMLPEYIVKDMLAQGLDPLNKEDIQNYWESKGISE